MGGEDRGTDWAPSLVATGGRFFLRAAASAREEEGLAASVLGERQVEGAFFFKFPDQAFFGVEEVCVSGAFSGVFLHGVVCSEGSRSKRLALSLGVQSSRDTRGKLTGSDWALEVGLDGRLEGVTRGDRCHTLM